MAWTEQEQGALEHMDGKLLVALTQADQRTLKVAVALKLAEIHHQHLRDDGTPYGLQMIKVLKKGWP